MSFLDNSPIDWSQEEPKTLRSTLEKAYGTPQLAKKAVQEVTGELTNHIKWDGTTHEVWTEAIAGLARAGLLRRLVMRSIQDPLIGAHHQVLKIICGAGLSVSAPSKADFDRLGLAQLQLVLLAIKRKPFPSELLIGPVPPGKLEANNLSEADKLFLQLGRRKSSLVGEFIDKYVEANRGEELAQAFRERYAVLREALLSPSEILSELQILAGGSRVSDNEHTAAVFTVLAYFFDSCDIFEAPSEASSDPT
jgi:hypothetical protein